MSQELFELLRDLFAGYGVISFICYPCWWLGIQAKAFLEQWITKDELKHEERRIFL